MTYNLFPGFGASRFENQNVRVQILDPRKVQNLLIQDVEYGRGPAGNPSFSKVFSYRYKTQIFSAPAAGFLPPASRWRRTG